jgi:type IV pilus assembly protein PilM
MPARLPSMQMRLPSLTGRLGQRGAPNLVGLDIQPGYVAAVQARAAGGLQVQKAAGMALPGDAMREGEVLDGATLSEALRELFGKAHLDKRVRVGVANQRTVLRMLEMPPLTDRKELAAAVRFQAEDQMPMPLENAVIDFHALGVIDTPAGPRQRVAVVAAQRDMVERLLSAVRRAGLRPEAIDLSAFALIRALHRFEVPAEGQTEGAEPARILYLNVGGLTNMAIAEGTVCRFTRVVGGGLESMAATVAERHHLPLDEARELLVAVDLLATSLPPETVPVQAAPEPVHAEPGAHDAEPGAHDAEPGGSGGESGAFEVAVSDIEPATVEMAPVAESGPDARPVLESGIRESASEVHNSLDFHRTQGGGGEVSTIVLSGSALAISGFSDSLSRELGMEVRRQTVATLAEGMRPGVSAEHLAVAAGLAVEEAPQR